MVTDSTLSLQNRRGEDHIRELPYFGQLLREEMVYDRSMRLRNYTVLLVFLLAAPLSDKEALPWVENDYTKAVARAKAEHVPIFAEAWAPW